MPVPGHGLPSTVFSGCQQCPHSRPSERRSDEADAIAPRPTVPLHRSATSRRVNFCQCEFGPFMVQTAKNRTSVQSGVTSILASSFSVWSRRPVNRVTLLDERHGNNLGPGRLDTGPRPSCRAAPEDPNRAPRSPNCRRRSSSPADRWRLCATTAASSSMSRGRSQIGMTRSQSGCKVRFCNEIASKIVGAHFADHLVREYRTCEFIDPPFSLQQSAHLSRPCRPPRPPT